MWYLQTMEYYSGMKKNSLLTLETMWMNVEDIYYVE